MKIHTALIILAVLFSLLSLVVLIEMNKMPIQKIMHSYHLIPETEPYTELFFPDHVNLPLSAKADIPISFRFTIHNVESKPITYKYQITSESTVSGTGLLDEGIAFLDHNASETFEKLLTIGSASGRTKIEVNLVNKEQPIHFWVNIH